MAQAESPAIMSATRFFIITGDPGVGKTTLTKKLASSLAEKGLETSGFYTEEVRSNGVRVGFDVVTLSGERGQLARDLSLLNPPPRCKVGKYGVLVEKFENVALPCLVKPVDTQSHILVIDEIGKMELFSQQFRNKVQDIFNPTSNCLVLATIPVRRSDTLVENIRNHSNSKVWIVTKENRNKMGAFSLHEDEILIELVKPHLYSIRGPLLLAK